MTELIFVLIAIVGYIIIRLLPSYTPEQVGSNKWIVKKPLAAPTPLGHSVESEEVQNKLIKTVRF